MQWILLLITEERPNIHTNEDHVAFVQLRNASDLIRSAELSPVLKESSETETLRIDSTEQNNFE